MTDLSEFMELSRPKQPPCPVGHALEKLPKEEAEQLIAACAQPVALLTNQAISQWLARRDLTAQWQRVRSHRNGTCACE